MTKYRVVGFLILFFLILGCKENSKKAQNVKVDENDSTQLIEKGKEITSTTFLALSSELQKAMKAGGVDHALAYCNVNAIAITDSLSNIFDVNIKRTSMKYRNPKNAPSDNEKAMLMEFENRMKNGQVMKPLLGNNNGKNTFYAPIIVQEMCLKCHGPKESIDNYSIVNKLYPDDLAHGYEQGDLRGIWSVEFRK